ncbi:MAG: acetyl-CoA carboxylase biotin carboxyl carrier protein subunit [Thermoleophilaceae bacterium]
MRFHITLDGGEPKEVVLTRALRGDTLYLDGKAYQASLRAVGKAYELSLDDRVEHIWLSVEHDTVHVHALGRAWRLEVVDPVEESLRATEQADAASAPMPGTVVSVAVGPGDPVSVGQQLLVIESMKMESEIVSWREGTVARVSVEVGEGFDRGATLVTLEAEEA